MTKTKKTPSGRRAVRAASSLEALLKAAGWSPSLPAARLGADGRLLEVNRRLRILLGLAEDAACPIATKDVEAAWPFFNEEDAKPALWRKLARLHPTESTSVASENGLKTFRLHLVPVARDERLLVAELVRSGDLLKDDPSRQALFRSLAHEIRTSVTALKGYASMLEGQAPAEILGRVNVSLGRLDRVVERLSEFRASLEGKETKS